ncbi:MAG: alcohol dehydrogenase catalytic domain-containing protein [Streptosporangiales bacterium]|nr:alcohol dehydrogenase catalytic domain-containing protein [Streptosporangiales bacterium]
MRAVRVVRPHEIEVAEVCDPEPAGAALVAVERAGICGSDVKIANGITPVEYPRVLGHEVVGRVARSGPAGRFAAGTRVLVDPFRACARCPQCLADKANLCPRGELLGREVDGGFAEYVAADEARLLAVPDEIATDDAGCAQVLGVCVHAQRLIGVFPGQTGVVVGLGAGGLLHLQLLRARGVREVVAVTRSAAKRALAAELGATVVCHPDDAAAHVAKVTDGAGADIVVEAVGVGSTFRQAVELAGPAGTVLLHGVMRTGPESFDFLPVYQKELTLVGCRAALPGDYATALRLLATGSVLVAPMRSASYGLERGVAAFDDLQRNSDLVKVLLEIG